MPSEKIVDPAVEAAYLVHQPALLRFLIGVLKDESLASDALQSTFVTLIERGSRVEREALKSWLFRVAYNCALNVRRRQSMETRSRERIAVWRDLSGRLPDGAEDPLINAETIERVQAAIEKLPESHRCIVEMRIRDELKFAEIAERLGQPLGTVLTRMRSSLATLRRILGVELE